MTPKELKKLLGFGEKQKMELKSGIKNIDSIGATVCGFLNTSGGVVICGVRDDINIVGVQNAKSEATSLELGLQEGLSPSALVSIEVFPVDGKNLILVDVPEGQDKPFAFKDNIFVWKNPKTEKANIQTIKNLVLKKSIEPERWERRISVSLSDSDLDSEELMTRVIDIQREHPTRFDGSSDDESVLNKLSLARYGQLTNAGDLFFSKNPALRLPQTRVRATCFADETSDLFKDNRIIEGPLVTVFNETFNFILRNVRRRSLFQGQKVKREDSYLYPAPAIREGLINAFAHRDYADYSGGITVNIYPSKLEIRNSGQFPKGITPENISEEYVIVLRNPDIANILHLLGLMDRVGRGGRLIVRECKEHGLPEPVWKSNSSTGVILTFRSAGELDFNLSGHQVDVMRKCLESCGIVPLMEVAGRSDRTKFRHQVLKPLLEAGLVTMTIPEKPRSSNQQYKLTPLGINVLSEQEN